MDPVMNMFRFAARFLIAFALAIPAAQVQAQTPQSYNTVASIAALKAMTNRPQLVQVTGVSPGIFNLSQGACSAADDVFQVQPTSGTTVCYTRMATPYSIGKSATPNGTVVTSSTGAPYVSGALSVENLPNEQILLNQFGLINWLRDFGREGSGTAWFTYGHGNWNSVQTALPLNPTEWQIWPSTGQGKAHCQNPGVTGVVIRDSGTAFDSAWVGRSIFYITPSGTIGQNQTVQSVTDTNTLTLSTLCNGAGSNTYQVATTSNSGVVNINGTAVTWVSGQPFNVFATASGAWWFNGVSGYTCSNITLTSANCNTTGTSAGVSYLTDVNIDDEVATINVQKTLGAGEEENLSIKAHANGYYSIKPQHSGTGTLWPLLLGAGNYSYDGSQRFQVGIYPTGDLSLGGLPGRDTIRIPTQTGQYATNYLRVSPGSSTSGFPNPSLAIRPSVGSVDTNIGFNIDTAGTGQTFFTSHNFGFTEFLIDGSGGSKYLGVGSDNTSPYLTARGTNANLALSADGSGSILLNSATQATSLTATGTLRANTGFSANGTAGVSKTVTVRDSAGTGTCTLIFTTGIYTGGTC